MNQLQATYGEGHNIRRCSTTEIQIGETVFQHSILLAPDQIITEWNPASVDQLTDPHFEQITTLSPELVLLGTGQKRALFNTPQQQQWLQRFPGMEVMDTASACRTYNLLLAEGRRVVAGLILER